MKAVIVEDAHEVSVRDIPAPTLQSPYDALTRVICGSLCNSTDLKIVHRQFDWVADYPLVLGHEVVGRVVEAGPSVRSFHVGDFVSRPRAAPAAGTGLSEGFGGFCEYGLVTDTQAMAEDGLTESSPSQLAAPADCDPAALTQMVTLRETLDFLKTMGVRAGQSLLIFGAGPVGLSFSLLARHLGLGPVIVVGRREEALRRALDFGRATHVINNRQERVPEAVKALTAGAGADWAIEAIGTDAILQDALDSLREAGRVGLYGVPPRDDGHSPLRQSARVLSAPIVEARTHEAILDWTRRGLIPAREFVTHELPMADVSRGLRLLESREAFKVLLWISPE